VDDDTDYKCYVLGCRSVGEQPLEEEHFRALQEEYLRRANNQELWADRSPIPQFVLEQLALHVAKGYRIAAGGNTGGEEPGTAACGVREPRVPLEPVLAGSAARSLPTLDSPDQSFWRT
jgi:hypothetical protein